MSGFGKTLRGYVSLPNKQRNFAYILEDDVLTVYSKHSLPLDAANKTFDLNCAIPHIIGDDISSGRTIVFFVDEMPVSDDRFLWNSITVKVYYCLTLDSDVENLVFDKISFSFKEIDAFVELYRGIKRERTADGQLQAKTLPYEKDLEKFNFKAMETDVCAKFKLYRTISRDASNPLSLSVILECSFMPTSDISLILHLYKTIKRTFYFLCHRQSIKIDKIDLYGMDSHSRRTTIGELYMLSDNTDAETKTIIDRTIHYEVIKKHFPKLVQLISDDKLYVEHIPRNEDESHHITAASFILEAAAFEWTFKQCYKDLKISDRRQQVKDDVLSAITSLSNDKRYNAKNKKTLNQYLNVISKMELNFSERVLYALHDLDVALKDYIVNLYGINQMDFNNKTYAMIAKDLENQRNAFAHGNIAKDTTPNFITDTIILSWINYCMVFRMIGFQKDEIKSIIKDIFRLNHVRIIE